MSSFDWKRALVALVLFGISFGYVEAAVVDYLRALYDPVRQHVHPGRSSDDLFPLLTLEQLRGTAPEHVRLLGVEVARELATLAMLGAVALAVARNAGQWLAAFAIAFGTWDVSFYVFLKVLLDWPPSLFTWDLLFLVPVPWAAPVLAPLLVSATMILAGALHLRREALGRPVHIRAQHWIGILTGAAVIVAAFTLEHRHLMAGDMPRGFNWALFGAGEAVGILSYVSALRSSRTR